MSFTLYNSTIPELHRALGALTSILTRAQSEPNSASFFNLRLHSDMLSFSAQVHLTTDVIQKTVHRLTGREPLELSYDEIKTFSDAYGRIGRVRKLLEDAEIDEDLINSYAGKHVPLNLGPGKGNRSVEVLGSAYVASYAYPNLFFHLTTAYAILRKEGIDIGIWDFMTPFMGEFIGSE